MTIVTSLINGARLEEFSLGHIEPSFNLEKDGAGVTLGTRADAIAIARGIIEALGDKITIEEPKPDRTELDKLAARWLTRSKSDDGSHLTWGTRFSLDELIDGMGDNGGSIYELVAYVGPKPQPAERKVVKL